jgi:predicted metal-binding protein
MIIISGSQVIPVMLDIPVQRLCIKPYPGHSRGCPNFNKKKGCPPSVTEWNCKFDISKPTYAIVNQFDLQTHVERMRRWHPDWSERKLVCCLYWQQTARRELAEGIFAFKNTPKLDREKYIVITCPEAYGVNVTETVKQIGIELEWPPKRYAYQVALAGELITNETNCDSTGLRLG